MSSDLLHEVTCPNCQNLFLLVVIVSVFYSVIRKK